MLSWSASVKVKIAPSILSADFTRLGEQVQQAVAVGAEIIHVDVMDGHFVPNMTVGPLVVAALKPITRSAGVLLETHLMIEKPERLIPAFAQAGADRITVHVETCPHLYRTLQQIKSLGLQAGVTLNPATSLIALEEILPEVDLALIMSVNPGFGGQEFIPSSLHRIARLRQMLQEQDLQQVEIEVDGGINTENAADIVGAGATILVSGSAVFHPSDSIPENITHLRAAANRNR
jgi:ribulose-phosphate 3-epimerase